MPRQESDLDLPLRRRVWRHSRIPLQQAFFARFAACLGAARLMRIRADTAGYGWVWAANEPCCPTGWASRGPPPRPRQPAGERRLRRESARAFRRGYHCRTTS